MTLVQTIVSQWYVGCLFIDCLWFILTIDFKLRISDIENSLFFTIQIHNSPTKILKYVRRRIIYLPQNYIKEGLHLRSERREEDEKMKNAIIYTIYDSIFDKLEVAESIGIIVWYLSTPFVNNAKLSRKPVSTITAMWNIPESLRRCYAIQTTVIVLYNLS